MLTDALTHLYASPERTRKLAAVAVAAIAVLILLAGIFAATSLVASSYADLQERRIYLGGLQLIVETAKNIDSPATDATTEAAPIFLEGTNKEVIGAELQNWLGQAADATGVELHSIENAVGEDTKSQSYVGLTATVAGSWKSVQNLVLKIETAEPMLFVRDVDIQSMSYVEEENVEPRVTMRISFFGAMRPTSKKEGA